jgi:hypothetical protein
MRMCKTEQTPKVSFTYPLDKCRPLSGEGRPHSSVLTRRTPHSVRRLFCYRDLWAGKSATYEPILATIRVRYDSETSALCLTRFAGRTYRPFVARPIAALGRVRQCECPHAGTQPTGCPSFYFGSSPHRPLAARRKSQGDRAAGAIVRGKT